jgi:hypothetical protein
MKLRHAAALALVGWYLLAPPASDIGKRWLLTDDSEPLAKWKLVNSFDSASECRDDLLVRLNGAKKTNQASTRFVESFKCIASDDPRLKEK